MPAAMALPPSGASWLAMTTNFDVTPASPGFFTAKYFWWVFMVRVMTSGGRSRKSGSISPSSGTGHSTRPATSVRRPGSSTSSRPASRHTVRAPSRMIASRSSRCWITWPSSRSTLVYCAKSVISNGPRPMRRWPSVRLPVRMPKTSKSTTWPSNRHRRRWIGRTQRWALPSSPNFMDLGQGKAFITSGIASAITSAVARPGFSMMATQNSPFLSSRFSQASRLSTPAPRRKPSTALSGAPTRGPLRSSRTSCVFTGRPSMARPKRRGPANVVSEDQARPAAVSFSPSRRSRSASAFGCMRAGISSQKISNRSSDIIGFRYEACSCAAQRSISA